MQNPFPVHHSPRMCNKKLGAYTIATAAKLRWRHHL